MSGLNHDFISLPHTFKFDDYVKYYNFENSIQLHDDLISYFWDTLKWIPIINPDEMNNRELGLQRWGVSIIDVEGAYIVKSIFDSWAQLFNNGPNDLRLTVGYSYEDNPDGEFERMTVNKEELIFKLKSISEYADKIIDNNCYILHLGV